MRKRKPILLLFCLFLFISSQAQVSKTINVVTAGTLSSLLSSSEKTNVTNLKISGIIDARDFKTMRDLIPKLADLDLSNTTIVAYTGTQGTDPYLGTENGTYLANAIPQHAFDIGSPYFGNEVLKNVKLPLSTTAIYTKAFASCRSLVSISVPNTVNLIENYAFYNCRALESFKIPDALTSITDHAFCSTGLKYLIIPNSVTSIDSQSFWGCDSLTMLSLPNSLNYISYMAFGNCGKLYSVYVYNSTPLSLDYSPFDETDIAHCTLFVPYKSKSLYAKDPIWSQFSKIVEDNTGFFLSSNSAMLLSESGAQTSISIYSNTDWSVSVDQNWLNVSPISGNSDNILNLTAEANMLFPTRTATIKISAKDKADQTITVIQDGFLKTLNNTAGNLKSKLSKSEKTSITQLKITGTMDTRDFKILRDSMPNLLSLNLKEANILAYFGFDGTSTDFLYYENEIPENAFHNTNNGLSIAKLKTIILPANTKLIRQSAFFSNTTLQNIEFSNQLTTIEAYAFSNCTSLKKIELPNSLINLDVEAFCRCSQITEVLVPNSVTSIGSRVFSNCSLLAHVTLPNSIDIIPRECFEYCTSLNNFTIPSTVKYIDMSAFSYCEGLTSISIPNSVTKIDHGAFEHCNRLKSVTIPNSVTYLGNYAFYFCDSIESITIPNSVTNTGSGVFEMCQNLKNIYNYCTTPIPISILSPIFGFVPKDICKLYVPTGTKSAYQEAFEWKDFKNSIEFTTGLQSISNNGIKIMINNSKLVIKNPVVGNKITIYSISGKKMADQFTENYQTEISLPKGVYIIQIGHYSDKIVIK